MKALLDILVEEKAIIKDIEEVVLAIGFTQEKREYVVENGPCTEVRRQLIKDCDDEIEQLEKQKIEYESRLKDIRNEIVDYLDFIL